MSEQQLKTHIIEALWKAVDQQDCILSATLTGSFAHSPTLAGLSDIDFVVIVDQLNRSRFNMLQRHFQAALEPVLAQVGYSLRLNPTLGPLKFNADRTAVLHLMLYSQEAHIEHVVKSPFTCLDWQQSPYYRKASLEQCYPAFGLQPRHFLSARRSITDYLQDYRRGIVSYRELDCDDVRYSERKCSKPMDVRDRHEFAYHVVRFLMLNLLKLTRTYHKTAIHLPELMKRYFSIFPLGEETVRPLLLELAEKKRKLEFDPATENLDQRLEFFVNVFEQQFRRAFIESASRHLVFRHAATAMNRRDSLVGKSEPTQGEVCFLGRSDPDILPEICDDAWTLLRDAVGRVRPSRAFTSPLARCRQSLSKICDESLPVLSDERLIEINYGDCEALTVGECRTRYPQLFTSWQQAEDPRFPNGENSADVVSRAIDFVQQHCTASGENTLVCTHNVVIRSLIGEALGIPAAERHRIRVPHISPIEFIATEKYGLFVDLNEDVERQMFAGFAPY